MLLQSCALARAQGTLLNYWNVPNSLPGSAGVPPAPSLAQPRPSPPLGSTGNGAMALLRPGRCGSRRQGGCLQHRTEAQRQPKGQHAGGTPALPGEARLPSRGKTADQKEPPMARMPAASHNEAQRQPKGQHAGGTPALPGAMALLRPGRCGSRRRVALRHCTEAQRQPKGQHAGGTPALPGKAVPAAPCGSFEGKRLIVNEDEPPMDKAVPPPQLMASRERGRPARTKPGTASAISPTWINRERRHGSPSAWPMQGGCTAQAQRQPKGQHAGGTPALPGKAGPAAPCGSFEGKRLIVNEDEPPMDTNRHE